MARAPINESELYPVYYLDKILPAREGPEVDDETLSRWERVWDEWAAVQREMKQTLRQWEGQRVKDD